MDKVIMIKIVKGDKPSHPKLLTPKYRKHQNLSLINYFNYKLNIQIQ